MNAVGVDYDLPPKQARALRKARRIEWTTIGFLASIVVVMGLTMGSSQTMKAMWLEDILSLVPSCAFLVGAHYRGKKPNETFPYGYRRAVLVAFMCGAVALLGFGILILLDSALKLIRAEHASVQTAEFFGHTIWMGWPMIAALVYSAIPPWVLGHMKKPLAAELHDKALHVSAELNKGDWLSGIAGVAGILGIAIGWWWMDSAAAIFISIEIVKDGWQNLRNSIAQLMNKRPSDIESKQEDPVIDQLQKAIEQLAWVRRARVRLREDGDVLTGEVFIEPHDDRDLVERLHEARDAALALDWRLHDVSMVPVRSVD